MEGVKICENPECKKVMIAADYADISAITWTNRRYCSIPCRDHMRKLRHLVKLPKEKTCECGCGQTFTRPKGSTSSAWKRRRYLNAKHASRAHTNMQREQRTKTFQFHNVESKDTLPVQHYLCQSATWLDVAQRVAITG